MSRERWWLVAIAVTGALLAAGVVLVLRHPSSAGQSLGPAADTDTITVGSTSSSVPSAAGPLPTPGTSPAPGTTTTGTSPTGPAPTTTTAPPPGASGGETGPAVPPPTTPALVTVPYLRGSEAGDAIDRLDSVGLIADISYINSKQCWVINQDPAAGAQVLPGSAVKITVGISSMCIN